MIFLGIMNIPQGMAYSLLATLPPVNGLYMSFFPVVIYAIFGTSRQLVPGAVAIVSLLTGGAIDKIMLDGERTASILATGRALNQTDEDTLAAARVSLACSLALLVGIIQLLMGVFGLG